MVLYNVVVSSCGALYTVVTTLYHCGCGLSTNVVVCALVVGCRRPDCPSPVVTRGFLSFPSSLLTSARTRCSSKNGRPLRCRPGESFIGCFIFLPHPSSSCVLPDACMCRSHIEKCMWWLSKISTSMPLKNGQCQELRGKKWNKRQKQHGSCRRI